MRTFVNLSIALMAYVLVPLTTWILGLQAAFFWTWTNAGIGGSLLSLLLLVAVVFNRGRNTFYRRGQMQYAHLVCTLPIAIGVVGTLIGVYAAFFRTPVSVTAVTPTAAALWAVSPVVRDKARQDGKRRPTDDLSVSFPRA